MESIITTLIAYYHKIMALTPTETDYLIIFLLAVVPVAWLAVDEAKQYGMRLLLKPFAILRMTVKYLFLLMMAKTPATFLALALHHETARGLAWYGDHPLAAALVIAMTAAPIILSITNKRHTSTR